jgi:hypothetical protein
MRTFIEYEALPRKACGAGAAGAWIFGLFAVCRRVKKITLGVGDSLLDGAVHDAWRAATPRAICRTSNNRREAYHQFDTNFKGECDAGTWSSTGPCSSIGLQACGTLLIQNMSVSVNV